MCILFIGHFPHCAKNGYKLIIASNRDEIFTRAATEAHFWKENVSIYGGQDMTPGKEGGTWLAASENGRVGVLLNLAGCRSDPDKLGRGFLVKDLLECPNTGDFLKQLQSDSDKYNGFHLVSIDLKESTLGHINNAEKKITYFPEGCFAFCNSSAKEPYQKAVVGQKALEKIINNFPEKSLLVKELFNLLNSEEPHLPDLALESQYKVSCEQLKALSAICVNHKGADYGTRTHTVILVSEDGKMDFYEWTLKQPVSEVRECSKAHQEIKLRI